MQAKPKSKSTRNGRANAETRRKGGCALRVRRSMDDDSLDDGRCAPAAVTGNNVAEAAIAGTRTACVLAAVQLRTVGRGEK